MKIHIGDNVVVTCGKDKNKTGTVLRVLPNKNRVVVSGINMRTKHLRATPRQAGQKITYEASIDVSNVALIDPKTKKATRIGSGTDKKGHKVRIAKKSGAELPKTKAGATTVKADDKKDAKAKKEDKKDEKATKTSKKEEKKTEVAKTEDTTAKPVAKKPFWKRLVSSGAEDGTEGEVQEPSHMNEDHSVAESNKPSRTRTSSRGS